MESVCANPGGGARADSSSLPRAALRGATDRGASRPTVQRVARSSLALYLILASKGLAALRPLLFWWVAPANPLPQSSPLARCTRCERERSGAVKGMYRIIGGDQKEYGPVSVEEVRRWIAEGRLHAHSLVRAEGAVDWRPLSSFPELVLFLTPAAAAIPAGTVPIPVQQTNTMAVLGLVCSCFALVCCCGCAPVGVLGIVFSAIGWSQANRDPAQSGKGIAVAGVIVGILSLMGSIIAFATGLFGTLIEEITKR